MSFRTKLFQNKLYLPLGLRKTLKVKNNDYLNWEVKKLGNIEIVVVSKDLFRGVRIVGKEEKQL